MKKLVLILVVIILTVGMSLSLTACNNATTQGQLVNILAEHSHETFTYNVLDASNNVIGTYTVDLTKKNANDQFTFGNATIKVNEGILVESVLSVGVIEYKTGCYYDLIGGSNFMTPAYTYRVEKEDGNERINVQGVYDGATLDYTVAIKNGESKSSSIKCDSPYYDNNEFHQLLRGVTTFSSSFSFTFNTPIVSADEETSVSLTASCGSTETINFNGSDIECYKVFLSRSTTVAGISQTLYYAVDDYKVNGWPLTHILVKFVENGYTYQLTSASLLSLAV